MNKKHFIRRQFKIMLYKLADIKEYEVDNLEIIKCNREYIQFNINDKSFLFMLKTIDEKFIHFERERNIIIYPLDLITKKEFLNEIDLINDDIKKETTKLNKQSVQVVGDLSCGFVTRVGEEDLELLKDEAIYKVNLQIELVNGNTIDTYVPDIESVIIHDVEEK